MGQIGVTVSSPATAVNGGSDFTAAVSSLENGVSVYTASANVTNQALKTLLSNYLSVFTIREIRFRPATYGLNKQRKGLSVKQMHFRA